MDITEVKRQEKTKVVKSWDFNDEKLNSEAKEFFIKSNIVIGSRT